MLTREEAILATRALHSRGWRHQVIYGDPATGFHVRAWRHEPLSREWSRTPQAQIDRPEDLAQYLVR